MQLLADIFKEMFDLTECQKYNIGGLEQNLNLDERRPGSILIPEVFMQAEATNLGETIIEGLY